MKIFNLCLIIAFLFVFGCSKSDQDKIYHSKVHFGSPNVRTVIVHSNKGLAATIIEIPQGIALSVFSTSDSLPNLNIMPVVIKGDLSIRTKAASELKMGPLDPQFALSEYRLDIKDAVATIDTAKK